MRRALAVILAVVGLAACSHHASHDDAACRAAIARAEADGTVQLAGPHDDWPSIRAACH
jgi:hypothetical protein